MHPERFFSLKAGGKTWDVTGDMELPEDSIELGEVGRADTDEMLSLLFRLISVTPHEALGGSASSKDVALARGS